VIYQNNISVKLGVFQIKSVSFSILLQTLKSLSFVIVCFEFFDYIHKEKFSYKKKSSGYLKRLLIAYLDSQNAKKENFACF
jgi:hypothetical protein